MLEDLSALGTVVRELSDEIESGATTHDYPKIQQIIRCGAVLTQALDDMLGDYDSFLARKNADEALAELTVDHSIVISE